MEKTGARSFRDLIVWQKAHALVLALYELTKTFPRDEDFGLKLQMRRAAVSVAANVAEGFKKRGRADKLRFFNTAQGSLEECKYFLILCHDLEYGNTDGIPPLAEEVGKLLFAYARSIQQGYGH
ncbi:MAG TPA: four helix bundle protein [Bacteroidota bacterium]|nr:four helix bundle protein [Bacteroidota bacterium]